MATRSGPAPFELPRPAALAHPFTHPLTEVALHHFAAFRRQLTHASLEPPPHLFTSLRRQLPEALAKPLAHLRTRPTPRSAAAAIALGTPLIASRARTIFTIRTAIAEPFTTRAFLAPPFRGAISAISLALGPALARRRPLTRLFHLIRRLRRRGPRRAHQRCDHHLQHSTSACHD